MAAQRVPEEMNAPVAAVVNEFGKVFFKPANRSVQEVKLKQRQKGYNNLMGMAKMVDDACEIAHGTEQSVQKNQGFALAFLNELELSILFDFVL
jgi:hypothetical protein